MNGKLICTIVLVASCSILISFTNGSSLREMETVPEFRSKSDNAANENKVMKVVKLFSQRNNKAGSGGNNEQLVSFLSNSERIQRCGWRCRRARRNAAARRRIARRKCLSGPGMSGRGRYHANVWGKFYFPKERNCDDNDEDNCVRENVANHHVQNKLSRFIDITNIDNRGHNYGYEFHCINGKEQSKSKNGNAWVFNGWTGTLCHLLNKPNPCKGFKTKIYEANGCDNEANCNGVTNPQARGLNRRIQLKVFVENGQMYYQVGLRCINGGIKKGCDKPFGRRRRLLNDGANGRRRRLLHDGARRS